jgi:hypothetical protein
MSKVSREEVIRAIYGQESSHGAADTSRENYAQARGPMQVTKPTFEGMKAAGLIPADYDHANPKHTQDAGNKLVGHLYDKYKGDPRKIAAAYYAGEKAVRADGSIIDYKDRKNAKAPTVLQYVAGIERRLGQGGTAAPVVDVEDDEVDEGGEGFETAQGRERKPNEFTAAMPPRRDPAPRAGAGAGGAGAGGPQVISYGVVDAEDTVTEQAEAAYAADQARQAQVDETSIGDLARAKFMHEGIGPLLKRIVRPDFDEDAIPSYRPDEKALAGLTEDERDHLESARSPKEFEFMRDFEMAETREANEIASRRGFGANLLGSALAGAPVDYVTGMGIARAFTLRKAGSAFLASQGRFGAATSSAVAENALGGAVLGGLDLAIDPYYGTAEFAMEVAGSAVIGTGLVTPGNWAASRRAAHANMERLANEAAMKTINLRVKAESNLGPGATPEAIKAEMQRLDGNEVRATIHAARAPTVADSRRLLPEEEELRADAPESEAAAAEFSTADDAAGAIGESVRPRFDSADFQQSRILAARTSTAWQNNIKAITAGEVD